MGSGASVPPTPPVRTTGVQEEPDRMSQMADEAKREASSIADQAKQQATSKLGGQKTQAVDSLHGVAQALRQSGRSLRDQDQSTIAEFTEGAAEQVERFSGYLRDRDVNELFREAERFARREPAIFLGAAFALGFLGARFLSSSRPRAERTWESDRVPVYRSVQQTGRYMPSTSGATGGPGYGRPSYPSTSSTEAPRVGTTSSTTPFVGSSTGGTGSTPMDR
jgi:hypothetical protein